MNQPERQLVMDERAVLDALARLAREIVDTVPSVETLSLLGIHRRGIQLAERVADQIDMIADVRPPVGSLDITLYRDDLMAVGPRPVVGQTRLPAGGIDRRVMVVVDDVFYTGRTVRAALDELSDFGRPARILLCVLVERDGRELPIRPDFVGRFVETGPGESVDVLVPELDGRMAVELVKPQKEGG
jgi:pyrimidine operon attenuation protein/uracil phosphoribosyltransferase